MSGENKNVIMIRKNVCCEIKKVQHYWDLGPPGQYISVIIIRKMSAEIKKVQNYWDLGPPGPYIYIIITIDEIKKVQNYC